jgi:uncharacterized ParB-like nuclease family protein
MAQTTAEQRAALRRQHQDDLDVLAAVDDADALAAALASCERLRRARDDARRTLAAIREGDPDID